DAREITNSIGYTRDDEGKCKSQYRDLGGVAAVVSADRLFYIRGSRRIGHFTARSPPAVPQRRLQIPFLRRIAPTPNCRPPELRRDEKKDRSQQGRDPRANENEGPLVARHSGLMKKRARHSRRAGLVVSRSCG